MSACISLRGSKACPAFQSASISTTGFVAGRLYVHSYSQYSPGVLGVILIFCFSNFLQFVSSRETFDQRLRTYVQTTYVQEQ